MTTREESTDEPPHDIEDNLPLVGPILARSAPPLVGLFRHFANAPTERNECFLRGYLAGLEDSGELSGDDHLALGVILVCARQQSSCLAGLRDIVEALE